MSAPIQLPRDSVGEDLKLYDQISVPNINTNSINLNGTTYTSILGGATGPTGPSGPTGPTGTVSNSVVGNFSVSGDLTVGGLTKSAIYNSMTFKKLTGIITAATPNNNVNSFTLSGFDSTFTTALAGTGFNVPSGVYSVYFSTSCGQPITTTAPAYSQSYMYPQGTGFVSSQTSTTATYHTSWPLNSSNNQQIQTKVYFPVAGTLQFSFFNNLGASMAANGITAIIVISADVIF